MPTNTQFPLHTAIWIVFNMIVGGTLAALIFNQSLSRLAISPGAKRKWQAIIFLFLITWFVSRMIFGHTRIVPPARLVLLSSLFFYLNIALAAVFSPIFRQATRSIPQERLIGMHTLRFGGFVFLTFLDMRLLPAQFALPAGYGDILVGLTAPLAVYALHKNKPYARELAIAWNFLGLLDFAIALVTGFTFIGPYVRQVARSGHSIAYLDYVLMIPGFGVPILMFMHVNSLRDLLKRNLLISR